LALSRLGVLALGATVLLELAATAAAAEEPYDGTYSGVITCAQIQGGAGPLKTRVSATVSGRRVTYERALLSPKGTHTGNFERGSGTVTESGDMTLAASVTAKNVRFDAEYRGKFLPDRTIRLIGGQRWQPEGRSDVVERTCFVDLAPSAAAAAESYDGVYTGRITCEPLRGHTGSDLNTAFRVAVTDGKIAYEREMRTPEGRHTGNFERGTGTISPSGEMALSARATGQGFRYDAEYKGTFTGASIRLTGGQSWQYDRQTGRIERPCFVELVKSPPKR